MHVCSSCNTSYHAVCSAELGGCATLGCEAQGAKVALATGGAEFQVPPERLEELRGQVALEREARTRRSEGEKSDEVGRSVREDLELIPIFLGCAVVLGALGYMSWPDLQQPSFTLLVSGLSALMFAMTGLVIRRVIKRPRSD